MNDQNCPLLTPDLSGVKVVRLQSEGESGDFRQARERDYESPHKTSESACGPKNGYIYYALSRGAKLKVEVDSGRFVFFYTPVEW